MKLLLLPLSLLVGTKRALVILPSQRWLHLGIGKAIISCWQQKKTEGVHGKAFSRGTRYELP